MAKEVWEINSFMPSLTQIQDKEIKEIYLAIFVIVLAVIILGLPTIVYPFGRDQGEYAWIAFSGVNGGISYSDIFNVKPPFTHLIHQAALLLFGYSMVSIRIFDLIWQTFTAYFIFRVARQIKQPSTASIIAAILYLFLYYKMDFWMTAQTDGFLTLPIVISIYFFILAQEKQHSWNFLFTGVMIGVAILLKYPIGILLPFLFIQMFIKSGKKSLHPVLLMCIGFLIPLITCVLLMIANGNLMDFVWIQSSFIPKYTTISTASWGIPVALGIGILHVLLPPVPGWVSLLGLYGLLGQSNHSKLISTFIIPTWWFSAVIHFIIQGKFYDYHMLPILAPLSLMSSNFFADINKERKLSRFTLGVLAALLIASPFFTYDFPQKYIRLWNVTKGTITFQEAYRDQEFDRVGTDKDFSSQADINVAEYLKVNTKLDEKIFIWGFEPSVYFLSERKNATRFIYNFPLYGPNASPELQAEFLTNIQKEKPTYILVVKNDAMYHVTATNDDSWIAFNGFNEFHNFVMNNYRFEVVIEDFVLFRLAD